VFCCRGSGDELAKRTNFKIKAESASAIVRRSSSASREGGMRPSVVQRQGNHSFRVNNLGECAIDQGKAGAENVVTSNDSLSSAAVRECRESNEPDANANVPAGLPGSKRSRYQKIVRETGRER